ncbi:MAG: hypothetical protein RI907_1559 [Pseudomonadota bacterium]|jgi:hypothetical protein
MPARSDRALAGWLLAVGPDDALTRLSVNPDATPSGEAGSAQWACLSEADVLADSACLAQLAARHGAAPLATLLIESPALGENACRAVLAAAGWPFAALSLADPAWPQQAEAVAAHALMRARQPAEAKRARWRWVCEDCDDAECERHGWLGAQR